MSEQNTSPVFPKNEINTYAFPDILREIMDNKKVSRLDPSWKEKDCYGFLKEGRLTISIKGDEHDWIITDGDLTANDWIVIPQANAQV